MLKCPHCGHAPAFVERAWPIEHNAATRREYLCLNCHARFVTVERIGPDPVLTAAEMLDWLDDIKFFHSATQNLGFAEKAATENCDMALARGLADALGWQLIAWAKRVAQEAKKEADND